MLFNVGQVSSSVPEGKGVSSSASVEVASMSAIAAAHGKISKTILFMEQSFDNDQNQMKWGILQD